MKTLANRFPEHCGRNALGIWKELGFHEREERELTPQELLRSMSREELRARRGEIQGQRENAAEKDVANSKSASA